MRSLPEDKRRDFLVDSGYLVAHWPKPWGRAAGCAGAVGHRGGVHATSAIPDMGITGWVTLTIAQAGTDDQRERWVEPVLRGQVDVVPAVLRTRGGLGCGRGADRGQAGRGRLEGDRPEGVDQPGPALPMGPGHRAHRPRRAQARRCHDDGHRHESTWACR